MKWSELFYPRGVSLNDTQKLANVRDAFAALATVLESQLPEGRYKAIVKTDLEKLATIATKSFTHEEPRKP